MQFTAFLIVIGGAFGATVTAFPLSATLGVFGAFGKVFFGGAHKPMDTIQEIIRYAAKARKNGIISLEADIKATKDKFMQKGLRFVVDGIDPKVLQTIMETEITKAEEEGEMPIKWLEAAGGFAPTFGIIGAVLGLIHVMKNLSDPSKLGTGIAVAFVATIYGLVFANIIYLPFGNKLKIKLKEDIVLKTMTLEGILAMQAGEHPQIIEERLKAFVAVEEPKKK